ncbi:MAG: trypsin-like serine protease [Deltaproteobacteria bacterium]|nr:trypsin-like serine protease [Deltaproteobacteria bacterium]
MKQGWGRVIYCLLAIASFVACGGGGSDSGEGGGGCEALNVKVFNGETCSADARSPVIALFPIASDGSQIFMAGICTGTLVTVDDVLTSAHCFINPLRDYGTQIVAFAAVVGGSEIEVIEVSNLSIHPFYDGSVGSPFDLAMATLAEVPSPAIGPVPILISQLTESGQRMSTFGYGTNNLGEVGVLKSAELVIDEVVGDGVGGNLLASLESSGASICNGDSGGPVIQVIDGVASVVGVNSFGTVQADQCAVAGSQFSGFVDLQYQAVIDFIVGYASDVTLS